MKQEKTERGFAIYPFKDFNGTACSLQKSSLATDHAIWLGIDDPDPQVMASKAQTHGLPETDNIGWVPYPIHEDVNLKTRMHLNQEMAEDLILILQRFVDTGEITSEN